METVKPYINTEEKVLDNGFVRLVDYMGDDSRVVQSARISYGAGTKTVREDRKLIHYLMSHEHWSPFEQVEFCFHIRLPIFVMRQLVRHRTAHLNEKSGRYSIFENEEEEWYTPLAEDIRPQDDKNKQSSDYDNSFDLDISSEFRSEIYDVSSSTFSEYDRLIDLGVARETARIILPLSTYTEIYWKIDLRNLFHFIKLRADEAAQKEIQEYAKVLEGIVKKICPVSHEAFIEYIKDSVRLSKTEVNIISNCIDLLQLQSYGNNACFTKTVNALVKKLGVVIPGRK